MRSGHFLSPNHWWPGPSRHTSQSFLHFCDEGEKKLRRFSGYITETSYQTRNSSNVISLVLKTKANSKLQELLAPPIWNEHWQPVLFWSVHGNTWGPASLQLMESDFNSHCLQEALRWGSSQRERTERDPSKGNMGSQWSGSQVPAHPRPGDGRSENEAYQSAIDKLTH